MNNKSLQKTLNLNNRKSEVKRMKYKKKSKEYIKQIK
jgi:hypothetical protein